MKALITSMETPRKIVPLGTSINVSKYKTDSHLENYIYHKIQTRTHTRTHTQREKNTKTQR